MRRALRCSQGSAAEISESSLSFSSNPGSECPILAQLATVGETISMGPVLVLSYEAFC